MRSLLREPLVHFLVIGAALFVAFDLAGGRRDTAPGKIVVTHGQVAALRAEFTQTRERPPTPGELDVLVQERIRDEVSYREALALGLDRDDAVIRNRLRQKLEFVSEDADALEPGDDELRAYFGSHPDAFRGADGGLPAFADAREAVRRAWMTAKRKEADDARYRSLLEKYSVVIER